MTVLRQFGSHIDDTKSGVRANYSCGRNSGNGNTVQNTFTGCSIASGKKDFDFKEVFRDNADFVWRQIKRLGVREADAEDVTQEVFLVVLRKLPEFDGRGDIRSWLYAICTRKASEYRRRAHVRREITIPPPAGAHCESESPSQHSLQEKRSIRETLKAGLSTLEPTKREVFLLYEVEELSMKEVAKAIGCPLFTAYSRLRAARKELQAFFETEGVML